MKPLLIVCSTLFILLSASTKCNKSASSADKVKTIPADTADLPGSADTPDLPGPADSADLPKHGNMAPIQGVIDTVKNFNPDTMKNPPTTAMIRMDTAMFIAQIDALTKLIKENPENAKAYAERGEIKSWINDYEGACADWKKAESLGLKEVKTQIDSHCR